MKTLILTFLAVSVILSSCDTVEWDEPGTLVPPTVDEDATLPSISVNGTRLHAETFGNPDDPMVVVLHGGPGGDYRSLLKCSAFAGDGYFVVFYDQRGSGLSRRHDKGIFTIQLFIDDLDAVILHYRRPGQRVVLLGQSWGAMLATAYVNQHPDVVSGVILSEPGGFTWSDAEAYIKRFSSPEFFDETTNDVLYLDQIITADSHNKLDYKAGIRSAAEFAPGNKLGIPGPSPFWRSGAVCTSAAFDYARDNGFDFTTNLTHYTTKVLFMYSELNTAYGRSHAEMVSSAFPNVDLVQINGTGHEIPYFGWDEFYPVVKNYLRSIQ
jgi:proline iminopeptidase